MAPPIGHLPYPGCETGGRPKKWTDERIDEEATLLLAWAIKSTSIVMGQHYGDRGYTYRNAAEWAVRNENFEYAKSLAMTIVGARREEMALYGKIDHNLVKASLALYDPDFKQYQLDLKATDEKRRAAESSGMIERICESIENQKNVIKKNESLA